MITNNRYFKYSVYVLITLSILILLGQLDYILSPLRRLLMILTFPFIGAAFFYYLLRPLVNYLEKKNIPRTLSVVVIYLALGGVLTLTVIFGGGFINEEFSNFYTTFSAQFEAVQSWAEEVIDEGSLWIFSIEDIQAQASSAIELAFGALGENITNWISTIANVSTIIILIPIVGFFLLKDEKLFYQNIVHFIPKRHEKNATELLQKIDRTLSIYITGQIIVAIFLGIITYIGYLIIGLPSALILAVFSLVTSIIPFVGPFVGVLPALFIGLTVDFFMIVKVLIVLTIAQQLEGNFIRPNVMGTRLKIHPLTVIFLIILSIALYGFIGAFLAIPIYAVLRVIAKHFYPERFGGETD